MCGINGFNWIDEDLIQKMNNALMHRGPDDKGTYLDQAVSLGSLRLSILDLSKNGHMPMISEDKKIVITYNGEIYNFQEIKKVLTKKGYKFNSNSDTEVILYSYQEWGSECVEKFKGMWAFTIYDKQKSILFLSRDRFGVKPLYYYFDNNKFIFSSEIKGILKHKIPRIANEALIFDFLHYNLLDHTEETFFSGIKKLNPGSNLIFDCNRKEIKIENYYNLKKRIKQNKDVTKEEIRSKFIESVKIRLNSDVPVGSCLSGGIDSSSIVCVMNKLNNKKINLFSLVFPGKSIDETEFQRKVVQNTDSIWHKTTFNDEDILKDLNDFIYTQEEPVLSLSPYGQYRVMKLVKNNGIKVVLDGQGADEILAGYHGFFAYYLSELFLNLSWWTFIEEIKDYYTTHSTFKPLFNFFAIMLPKRLTKYYLRKNNSFISNEFFDKYIKRKSKDIIWDTNDLKTILYLSETYSSLPQLLRYEDKNSMRWSVESRVPFCDHELVEIILSLPSKRKIKAGKTKIIFKNAMNKIIPNLIRTRTDKIGFETPDADLLKTQQGKKFASAIINSNRFKKRAYWNEDIASKMLEEHSNGDNDNATDIWKMIILEMWHRLWINGN